MGSLTSKPLHTWTSGNVSAALASLGPQYIGYGAFSQENGVDGDLLVSMNDMELSETLVDIGIHQRLHRRVVMKKLNDLKEVNRRVVGQRRRESQQQRQQIELRTAQTNAQVKREEDLVENSAICQDDQDRRTDTSSRKRRIPGEVAAVRERTASDSLEDLVESDLNVFDDIILKVLNETSPNIVYAGIHLVREEGSLVLSGSLRNNDSKLQIPRFLLHPSEVSICSAFVRETQDNFLEKCVPQKMWDPKEKPPNYSGYVVKDEHGNRLGTLCILDTSEDSSSEEKELMLRELAAETERLVQERKALLTREASLQAQIQSANRAQYENFGHSFKAFMSGDIKTAEAKLGASCSKRGCSTSNGQKAVAKDKEKSKRARRSSKIEEPVSAARTTEHFVTTEATTLKAAGLLSDVHETTKVGNETANVTAEAQTVEAKVEGGLKLAGLFHNVQAEDIESYPFDTSNDPEFQVDRATSVDAPHIPSSIFDICELAGIPRPPIAKDDMQSVATVEDLDWPSITPGSKIGRKIERLISMAARMFDFPAAYLVFHDHKYAHATCTYVNVEEVKDMIENGFQIETRYQDGTPYLWHMDRGGSICNYTIFLKKTFVVRDMSKDKTFAPIFKAAGVRAYVGCPLIDEANRAIGNICMFDLRPRPDITRMCEVQLEQIAYTVLQELQNWSMRKKIQRLEKERTKLLANVSSPKKSQPPQGEATIVLTDVEGSTRLWEMDSNAMQAALETHDKIMREHCIKFNGYEIDTEGDAFFLAFHDPVDAVAFALSVQLGLHEAVWNDDILALAGDCEETKSFRGLRVRIGMHHGPVATSTHEVTKRTDYSGPAWNLARSVESMAHGGQILATLETWNLSSSLGERVTGPCQVLDLGTHVLRKGKEWDEGVVSKSVVQLVPESLSFDYFKARRPSLVAADESEVQLDETTATLKGRQFPPILTKRQVGPSFHDAPFRNNMATIMFISTSEVEQAVEDFQDTRTALLRLIGELVIRHSSGYHCHCFMIAFNQPNDAISFGLKYLQALREREAKSSEDSVKLSRLVKLGCVHGQFLSMGPHKRSGRADYFGKAVNRAARVANAAAPGTVYLGVSGQRPESPAPLPGISLTLVGVKPLKGVMEEVTLYECNRLD